MESTDAARDAGIGGVASRPEEEFDRQVETLCRRGYPALVEMPEAQFRRRLALLRQWVPAVPPVAAAAGRVPFVLVIASRWVPADRTVGAVRLAVPRRGAAPTDPVPLGDRPGFSVIEPDDLARFRPVEELPVPDRDAYLLVDADRGSEFRGVAPAEVLPVLAQRGRTPLTVAEGIAVATHAPWLLVKNHCFSLAGSSCGDRRVPALWISQRAPKLGWCWAGNPHTWLGCASAAARRG